MTDEDERPDESGEGQNEVDEWQDESDEWSSAIEEAHPARSGAHDTYRTAMEMVGRRRSKRALVDLVNWLLFSHELQVHALMKEFAELERHSRGLEESLDNVREALGQENTHHLIMADDVGKFVSAFRALAERYDLEYGRKTMAALKEHFL